MAKNKIYDTAFPIIDKTDIFLLILYLLFFKSNFAFPSLYFLTKLDEPSLFLRYMIGGSSSLVRRKSGGT